MAEPSTAASTWSIMAAAFIACKLVGEGLYVSTWSWWWILAPGIPWIGTFIHFLLHH